MVRNLSLIFAVVVSISVQAAGDDTKVPIDDKKAMEFYAKSQLVISKATVNPYELAGCLVLQRDGQDDEYLNVLPESIKKTLKPQTLSNSPYRTMLTKEQAAKVGFLGALGISTTEKSLLEMSINELWRVEGPSFLGHEELKKVVLEVGRIYVKQGYKVKYNQNVQYAHLVTSQFQENKDDVTSTFTYFDASGKKYVQSSNYFQKEIGSS